MKLKTLKDIETVNGFVSLRKAKELAIKWVKNSRLMGDDMFIEEDFMKFHNITSEDLVEDDGHHKPPIYEEDLE